MALEVAKTTGMPLAEGLESVTDLPHTISFAITYRIKLNSFYELPRDKQPPRNLWDKPYRLNEYLEQIFKTDKTKNDVRTYVDYDLDEIE